jgi:signal transduction histidine kinase
MAQGGEIRISAKDKEEEIEIEFSDTGCGIPLWSVSRIFDPFFSTKQDGKGTGLGLWVCYGIMQRHGGTIQAVRKKKGASFLLTLPKFTG